MPFLVRKDRFVEVLQGCLPCILCTIVYCLTRKLFAMNVKMQRSYKSRNGNRTFVYAVSGTQAELEAFKEAQGEFYREDDTTGTPLWFTTRCIGKTGTLLITEKGNVVPDMSAFDEAASLAEQYGGNLGEQLAKEAAQRLLGGRGAAKAQSASKAESADDEPDTDIE